MRREVSLPGGWPLTLYALVVVVFLLAPLGVVVASSFTASNFTAFPPQGFSLRWYAALLEQPEFLEAFWLSLWLAALATLLATVIGTLAALGIVRYRFPGRDLANSLVLSPLLLPGVITGIALLQFFAMIGVSASFGRLLLGHVIITVPYVVRSVAAVLVGFDRSLEEAAQSLGAHPVRAVLQVTLPVVRAGVIAGAVFAFVTSFDNVVVSIFLTSPTLVPLPVRLYNYVESSARPLAASISTLQILVIVGLLWLTERGLGFSRNL
jgi:putative spermidine/putrescine transport system permease protein